jgi:hypothetical protein
MLSFGFCFLEKQLSSSSLFHSGKFSLVSVSQVGYVGLQKSGSFFPGSSLWFAIVLIGVINLSWAGSNFGGARLAGFVDSHQQRFRNTLSCFFGSVFFLGKVGFSMGRESAS